MGTFLDRLSDSSSAACFIARMHSTAIVAVTAAPKIAPTKNDLNGDIFNLVDIWFDMSGFVVLLLMARLLLKLRMNF